jgi:hypothetical protein
MRAMKAVGMMSLVLSVAVLAGCDKTFRITVTNVSPAGKEAELLDPSPRIHPLGVLATNQSVTRKVTVPSDEFPATFELRVGGMNPKSFTLTKKDQDHQFLYIEDKQIVGPLDENKEVKNATRFEGSNSRTGDPVIRGDSPNTDNPPKDPKKSGGEVIIDRQPVVD